MSECRNRLTFNDNFAANGGSGRNGAFVGGTGDISYSAGGGGGYSSNGVKIKDIY